MFGLGYFGDYFPTLSAKERTPMNYEADLKMVNPQLAPPSEGILTDEKVKEILKAWIDRMSANQRMVTYQFALFASNV